jgi:hypothetical protein
METSVHIAHFLFIETANGQSHYYQNYFFNTGASVVAIPGTASPTYRHAPFRVEGALSSLNGENSLLRVLFPHSAFTIALVENGEGNRLSKLSLKTVWMATTGSIADYSSYTKTAEYEEFYVGVGASFDDTTVELRFRSAMDSVGASFPRQAFSSKNVGFLPLNAEISLR